MNTTAINKTIADTIIGSINGLDGKFSLAVEIDANTLAEVHGHYEIQGYCEDDYFNGTGAWITTYANVILENCDVFTYDEDGEEIENNIDPDLATIERYVEKELE